MEGLGKRRLALSLLLYIAQGAVAAMLVRCKIPIGQAQLHQPLFFVCTASSFTPLSDRRTAAKNIGFTAARVHVGCCGGDGGGKWGVANGGGDFVHFNCDLFRIVQSVSSINNLCSASTA